MKKYTFSVHGISPDTDTVTAYVDVKYSMLPLMSLFSLQVTMDRKPDCSIDYYESQAIKQAQAVIADVVAETNAVNAGMVIGTETKDSHTNTHVGFSVQQFTLCNPESKMRELLMYVQDGQIFMNESIINKAWLSGATSKTLEQRVAELEKRLAAEQGMASLRDQINEFIRLSVRKLR